MIFTCLNHPAVPAAGPCSGCSRPFCASCLVEFMGAQYCGGCRDQRLGHLQYAPPAAQRPATFSDHLIPARNPTALAAYYCGVFGLIPCIGNLLGPAAVLLGVLGLRACRENPAMPGKAHAVTGLVLGSAATLLYWGLFILFWAGMILYNSGD